MTLWAGRVGTPLAPEVWAFLRANDAELLLTHSKLSAPAHPLQFAPNTTGAVAMPLSGEPLNGRLAHRFFDSLKVSAKIAETGKATPLKHVARPADARHTGEPTFSSEPTRIRMTGCRSRRCTLDAPCLRRIRQPRRGASNSPIGSLGGQGMTRVATRRSDAAREIGKARGCLTRRWRRPIVNRGSRWLARTPPQRV